MWSLTSIFSVDILARLVAPETVTSFKNNPVSELFPRHFRGIDCSFGGVDFGYLGSVPPSFGIGSPVGGQIVVTFPEHYSELALGGADNSYFLQMCMRVGNS